MQGQTDWIPLQVHATERCNSMTQIEVKQHRRSLPSDFVRSRVDRCFRSTVLCRSSDLALQALLLISVSSSLPADDQVDYGTQIKPVLVERCVACHGALKQEGGLRLDTAALAITGGDSGAAIVPGDAAASLLLDRVTAADESERMPPEGEPLTPDQIAALRNWIAQEAPAPIDEQPQRDPREHWAFQTPNRAAVPEIENPSPEQARWQRNPIDAFIASEHRKHGLTAQPEADKRVWLRRVSLDLTGLPPTTEKLDAFLADETPEAHNRVVTRLLASPQYGQRWGRHWMDIWRYSDWWGLGAEVRNSQKHIWHWRDWIVESVNSDKGYDQMLREMLAADELYPNDLDRLRATGYLARQYFIFNRTTWLDETLEHTAKSMLGLTVNCAKCHDHKYDPLSHVEYYRLRAIFEPYQIRTEMVPGQPDFEKDGIPRVFDAHLDVPTYVHVRGDDRNPDTSRTIEPGVPAFLTSDTVNLVINPVSLPIEAVHPGLRERVVATHRDVAEKQLAAARTAVETAEKNLRDTLAAAAAPEEPPSLEAETEESSNIVAEDDFADDDPQQWEVISGQWNYQDGHLVQSLTGSTRAAIRLKQRPPADFEARLKFIPTGGDVWKSVGISFDVTDDGNEVGCYASAYADGPKAQVMFRQNGAYVYPAGATQPREIKLNEAHEIILRVRGTLLNVAVDGVHAVAWRMPDSLPRQTGSLELFAFDAQVEFTEFELCTLPPAAEMIEPSAATPAPSAPEPTAAQLVERTRLEVTIARKSLQSAEARLAAVNARAAADRARHFGDPRDSGEPALPDGNSSPTPAATEDPAFAAAKAERVLAAALADEEQTRAELHLLQAPPDQKAAAEEKLTAARAAFEAAHTAIDMASDEYTPLPGAKKTQEDYQNRNADAPFPASSSGRRSAFAKWLTDPDHPLPARVAVNHIWMRHMGKPLVPTVFDFGLKGAPPTHPALLDWLAVEFVESGWSMKHIHHLIVTSQTYRQSSSNAGAPAANLDMDPDNRFYWRMNPVRMEAQIVRDSLLYLAGELDVSLGGPSIPVNDERSRRRSMYFVHSHNDHHKFLSMFDDANVLDCYRRAESIVPQQALALENSPLAGQMADKIAQRITTDHPSASDGEFVRAAFIAVLAVEPTSDELATLTEYLERMTEFGQAGNRPRPTRSARTNLVHTLLNHNDFITIR